jgi:hypothetical protein
MTAETAGEAPQGIPLDYGKEPSRAKRVRAGIRAAWAEYRDRMRLRSDKDWKAIGYFLASAAYAVGGFRQVGLALGLAFFSGGLGLALEAGGGGFAPVWMWLGGLLAGLSIPLPNSTSPRLPGAR